MKWYLKLTHRKTGNRYYFIRLISVDGVMKPVSCMGRNFEKCTQFSSIAEACAVVRQIDHDIWRCIIMPLDVSCGGA